MPETVSADAPGRVNLIGEHTDYHQGFVLPVVIPQRTHVRLQRRTDGRVHASTTVPGTATEEYAVGSEAPGRGWLDYVQGVTMVLARHGVAVPGFDLAIDSSIPLGAGVSSSAALEVSLLRALKVVTGTEVDDVTLAKLAQQVETDFVGAPVGIMDQMASSVGRDGEALFLDTRTLAFERVPLPDSIDLIVIHSGISHTHAGGAYVTRRRESFEAASRLGVTFLRDLDRAALPRIAQLPPVLARRARHIVTENARVIDAVRALRDGDAARLGALFTASHVSMRDDYEISTPEIDLLVRIGEEDADVYGARLTGGGFGGAVVMIAKAGRGCAAARSIRDGYSRQTGRDAAVLIPSGI